MGNKKQIRHGYRRNKQLPPEYRAWVNIKSRCYDEKVEYYKYYGGRGIKMCDKWLNNFKNFYEDMGPRPSPKHSIDRYPNKNGNYEPSNCRWATQKQQSNNKSTNVDIEYAERTMTLQEWSDYLGIHRSKIAFHLKTGKSFDEIISLYKMKNLIRKEVINEFNPQIEYKNRSIGKKGYNSIRGKEIICNETLIKYGSISEAARMLNMSGGAIWCSLNGVREKAKGLSFKYI